MNSTHVHLIGFCDEYDTRIELANQLTDALPVICSSIPSSAKESSPPFTEGRNRAND